MEAPLFQQWPMPAVTSPSPHFAAPENTHGLQNPRRSRNFILAGHEARTTDFTHTPRRHRRVSHLERAHAGSARESRLGRTKAVQPSDLRPCRPPYADHHHV